MPATLLDPGAWRGYRMDRFPEESWAVEGGVLRAIPGAEPISLVSREAFADFSLVFEWRLAPGGNSGVLYRVSEDADAPWQSGLEMQLLDDAGHPDGRVPETRCGALYGLYPREMDATCPPGAYNEGRIRVRGNEVEHWLNGTCVLRFEIGAEPFLQRLGRSKFAHCPLFAKEKRGHLVLQHHGDEAWFRNLRLE
jgi:hypothetical protein